MIDLTPLDVRKKRGDFRRVLRGYDADEVDSFIEMVAERLEELVKENLKLEERVQRLQDQVSQQEDREQAVREALVTAQELRRDMRLQARREAELLRKEAESEIGKIIGEAERQLSERQEALAEMERMRLRFLKSFRALLEREMDAVEVEEGRKPLEDTPLEIDFTVKDIETRVDFSRDLDEEEEEEVAPDREAKAPSSPASAPEATATGAEAFAGTPGAPHPESSPAPEPSDEARKPSEEVSPAEGSSEPSVAGPVEDVDEEEGEGPLLLSPFLEEREEERSGGGDAR